MKSAEFLKAFDQIDNMSVFNNFENLKSVYHYSVPNTKLFYPEPFIAAPSFMHSDLWFVHILLYQYWLWFVFIFIIVFFFITFLCTVRWCNMRVRPRKETRGVSRSKCGDLITATVPVTWATSIIVNESTDAIDYYDGFGTTELVVGIRAYQWGWEYYYPKDIDLNYNLKPNYSVFIGNSLKYNKTSDTFNQSNNLWKFYQNKTNDLNTTPLFFLLSTFDMTKLINFWNFNEIGSNPLIELNAFKKLKVISKFFNSNLVFTPSNYYYTFNFLNKFYLNENYYDMSYQYGTKKQHNFLSTTNILNNQKTFFNTSSMQKIMFNDLNSNFYLLFKDFFTFFNILNNKNFLLTNSISFNLNLNKTFVFHNQFLNLNNNSDLKNISNVNLKFFNDFFNQKFYFTQNTNLYVNKFNINSELQTFKTFSILNNFNQLFFNLKKSEYSLFSNNQTMGLSEKNLRNFTKILPNNKKILNYFFTNNKHSNIFNLSQNVNSNYLINELITKISNNRINADYPYLPLLTLKKNASVLTYDSVRTSLFDTALPLQGKEDLIPNTLLNIYWNFYFSNSNQITKFLSLNSLFNSASFFYLPAFVLYYDYDFRNWQASELLEDSIWETIYPMYSHFEYLDLKSHFNNQFSFTKLIKHFNVKNRTNGAEIIKIFNNDTPSFIFLVDDFFCNLKLLNTKNYQFFSVNQATNSLDDSYETLKFFSKLNFNNNKLNLLNQFSFLTTHSYSTVLDYFRSDFNEFSWFKNYSPNTLNYVEINTPKSNIVFNNLQQFLHNSNDSTHFTNNINLRATAKNSIVTYNAMQKVFKTRFDENRSHARLNDLSNSFFGQNYLTMPKISYETILGKNKSNYIDVSFYKHNNKYLFNNYFNLETILNFSFYDFPFLLAYKSDSSRYIWFDWFAKWGYYEVQPSSSSRYAIFGMPYFSKNFEFSTTSNDALNESENYLIRIARARKNYLPNWTYTPYFYLKNNIWYKQNIFFYLNSLNFANPLNHVFFQLNISSWYWTKFTLFPNTNAFFAPSNSNTNSYARIAPQNNYSSQGYYYLMTNLADILTKREYLYRDLFFKKNKIVDLYTIFTNTPKNSLFFEIKANLEFSDTLVVNNEYSREFLFYSLTAYKNSYFKQLFNTSFLTIFEKIFSNYFVNVTNNNLFDKTDLYKNQFRPMRKGITNMIRLHATGAIALPIEIRLQVLASSKDVIHSWAIPSAGIKIDCVPGYSSHRVMIFLVSGIYWGQCMEICGRYHHWMPIVVYFMKRDLFFLWCTHFIHLNANSSWNTNDRQFSNLTKTVSFNKNSWLHELNN